ncbi:MAG: single-stranded-DNA-specific exonuclease RecJ [Chloroflexi bacterium RBG_13_46_14]|nr:MAG: single-stranded-DNA-specific exonuclease RecJ [Chloroflexi bacterium RBG_13_46_14]
MSHNRWNLLPFIPDKNIGGTGIPLIIRQLLYNRGITQSSEIETFLAADERLRGDPNILPGMHEAVARLYRALLSREKIAIYGDFDADGITATALLVQGLSMLDCEAVPYIPDRINEGYGLKTTALETLRRQGVNLVVTVDCGITAASEIKKAGKMGLDIIVTDHHIPSDDIPSAVAVIDPKLPGSVYPTPELAGVGVAMKLLEALFLGLGKEGRLEEVIDLVALGTVADMVPLLGENRYLVKQGLRILNNSPRLGIQEIINRAGLDASNINSTSISWTIAPRLNAAGRVGDVMNSYRLLITDSMEEARQLAEWLEQKNLERQKLTALALSRAREQVITQVDQPLLIASDPGYPAGIIGLVAGKLAEEHYKPVIVIRTGDRYCGGSSRSIPEFNMIEALNKCSHLLTRFGGHARAAGLSLYTRNLPQLKQALLAIAAEELEGVDLRPRIDIDAETTLPDLGGDTYPTIQQMAPFGQGNPVPTFLTRGVEVVSSSTMGSDNSHLRMKVKQGAMLFDAVGFGLGNYVSEISNSIDIVYNLEMDHWNGQSKLRLNVLDFESVSP